MGVYSEHTYKWMTDSKVNLFQAFLYLCFATSCGQLPGTYRDTPRENQNKPESHLSGMPDIPIWLLVFLVVFVGVKKRPLKLPWILWKSCCKVLIKQVLVLLLHRTLWLWEVIIIAGPYVVMVSLRGSGKPLGPLYQWCASVRVKPTVSCGSLGHHQTCSERAIEWYLLTPTSFLWQTRALHAEETQNI